jgi:hypothetical protein
LRKVAGRPIVGDSRGEVDGGNERREDVVKSVLGGFGEGKGERGRKRRVEDENDGDREG